MYTEKMINKSKYIYIHNFKQKWENSRVMLFCKQMSELRCNVYLMQCLLVLLYTSDITANFTSTAVYKLCKTWNLKNAILTCTCNCKLHLSHPLHLMGLVLTLVKI